MPQPLGGLKQQYNAVECNSNVCTVGTSTVEIKLDVTQALGIVERRLLPLTMNEWLLWVVGNGIFLCAALFLIVARVKALAARWRRLQQKGGGGIEDNEGNGERRNKVDWFALGVNVRGEEGPMATLLQQIEAVMQRKLRCVNDHARVWALPATNAKGTPTNFENYVKGMCKRLVEGNAVEDESDKSWMKPKPKAASDHTTALGPFQVQPIHKFHVNQHFQGIIVHNGTEAYDLKTATAAIVLFKTKAKRFLSWLWSDYGKLNSEWYDESSEARHQRLMRQMEGSEVASGEDEFHMYHEGFSRQRAKWSIQPDIFMAQRAMHILPPSSLRLADFGCGEARFARVLAKERPSWEIISFDHVRHQVKRLTTVLPPTVALCFGLCPPLHTPSTLDSSFLSSAGIQWWEQGIPEDLPVVCCDLADQNALAPYANHFDAVFCTLTLMGKNWQQFIDSAIQVVRPRGSIHICESSARAKRLLPPHVGKGPQWVQGLRALFISSFPRGTAGKWLSEVDIEFPRTSEAEIHEDFVLITATVEMG